MNLDDPAIDRLVTLLRASLAGLDPADVRERLDWCEQHRQPGTVMHIRDGGLLEFVWGGRILCMVKAADLHGDEPIFGEFIAECPDVLPEDWT